MTAVLLMGDMAATASERIPLKRPETTALEPAFLEVIGDLLADSGAVLAVYPAWSWRGEVAERLVRLARSALCTDRVAGIPLPLPPLALGLAADRLTAVAPRVSPGALATHRRDLTASPAVSGAASELPDDTGKFLRLVQRDERVAVVHLDQPSSWQECGEAATMLRRHHAVFAGPDHKGGAVEVPQALGRSQ